MTAIRRLAWISVALAFGHIVFGAIVRISGSGLGCGDHWPKCHGYWFPPLERTDLIIEVSHRYFAAALSLAIVTLLATAWRNRREAGVSGSNGVLRPIVLSTALVISAALFGAVVVKLELTNKFVIVTHLAIAMSLLGALLVSIVRSGGPPRIPEYAQFATNAASFGSASDRSAANWIASRSTARSAFAAAGLTFLALVLGALTAHIPGANVACQGFPLCRGGLLPTLPAQYVQFAHRLVAFTLFFHLVGMSIAISRRGERKMAAMANAAVTLCILQLLVAAAMVEMQLPPVWRSLHEAVGTLLWLVVFLLALVARRASTGLQGAAVPAVRPRVPVLSGEATA